MAFQFSESHITQYFKDGYTVFRNILPLSLMRDLRREADKGREIAHNSKVSQRIQPITKYQELSVKPFEDYVALPILRDALDKLTANTTVGTFKLEVAPTDIGVLYEPRPNGAWCTHWHRDWRDNIRALRLSEWDKYMLDWRYFNQTNAPLYDDSCTWVVPGSHLRRDTPAEIARFPDRPLRGVEVFLKADMDMLECETISREYTWSMPGAVQAHLNAGDYMIYRNCLWHTGNYVAYRKRATIHHPMYTPEYRHLGANIPFHPQDSPVLNEGYENPNFPPRPRAVTV